MTTSDISPALSLTEAACPTISRVILTCSAGGGGGDMWAIGKLYVCPRGQLNHERRSRVRREDNRLSRSRQCSLPAFFRVAGARQLESDWKELQSQGFIF
jgi:hypothetical protein